MNVTTLPTARRFASAPIGTNATMTKGSAR